MLSWWGDLKFKHQTGFYATKKTSAVRRRFLFHSKILPSSLLQHSAFNILCSIFAFKNAFLVQSI
jgi:hypothetical protein